MNGWLIAQIVYGIGLAFGVADLLFSTSVLESDYDEQVNADHHPTLRIIAWPVVTVYVIVKAFLGKSPKVEQNPEAFNIHQDV